MKIQYSIALKKTAFDQDGNVIASGVGSRFISTDKLNLDQKKELHSLLPDIYVEAIENFNRVMEEVNGKG